MHATPLNKVSTNFMSTGALRSAALKRVVGAMNQHRRYCVKNWKLRPEERPSFSPLSIMSSQPTVTLNKFDPNDENLSKLLENNRAWAAQVNKEAPDFFKQSNQGQSPKILWIGCSDSRVPAEQILQLGPGEVFVHRNIANVVTNSDFSCLSVVQYAVEVLKVQHIVVCGHYNCGGVAAAHGHTQVGLIDNWLRNIKDVYRLNSKELQGISDEKQRMRRLVELNAINSAKTVSNTTIVQNAWKNGQKLTVHAWAHDLADGLARPLDWRVSDAKALEDIYVM